MTTEFETPEFTYARFRAALALFGIEESKLTTGQRRRAEDQARREYRIETRVLSAREAAGVIVGDAEVDRAIGEIRGRFSDDGSFHLALEEAGLDLAGLRLGLARQCRVGTVLDRIEASMGPPPISTIDVELYYHSHYPSFQQPERREAFHILVSINDDYAENTRVNAKSRIQEVAERLGRKPGSFGKLALKYSECPTAMAGGRIGLVRRGQLYPELDEALFSLATGEVSGVVESQMGFHLVRCNQVIAPHTLSLKRAAPHIRRILADRFRESRRREWIASLGLSIEEGGRQ
ncbi:MAG: nitrogen fixation protein NifM [Methylotetracoccus sp.]